MGVLLRAIEGGMAMPVAWDFDKLEAFIQERMAETKLPGLSIALVKGDEVIWARGFGFRDLERGLPATPETLYATGSVTKSFTAIAVLQLAEQGKLNLDDPVEAHLPFKLKPQGEKVCIWHLLTHSSGFPALAYAEASIRAATGAGGKYLPIATCDDMLTFIRDAEGWALARPGERWFYLNEGYVLLGCIVQRCSGLPYETYVREHILKPLRMMRSTFRREDVEKDPDAATPYIITRDGEQLPSRYPYEAISADGGLISSVLDLAKYIGMLLNRGEHEDGRLLSRESIEEMEKERVQVPWKGPFGPVYYAYGLSVTSDFLGRRLVGHGGSVLVATAYMGFIPEERVGVALLANGSGYPMAQLGQYALALLLGRDPEKLPFVARERRLKELEGLYETYKGTMQARVRRQGDFLLIEIRDKYTELVVPLVPEALDEDVRTFYTLSAGQRLPVEFRVCDGQVELIYERYLLRRVGKLPTGG
jgi:CubicO group peptidase (beta-lactamase class C family)